MSKLKVLIKRIIVILINLILPIISKIEFSEDVQKAKKEILSLEKIATIYEAESLKRTVRKNDEIDLSIIIPVYNAEKTLEMCLNSIVHQETKYQFEVILINDGSTDNSNQILNNYKTQYAHIIVLEQKNGGAGKARNTGINNARRKIYWFY